MTDEVDIRVRDLSKVYRIYEKPEDRLVQMATLGRVRRFTEFPALSGVSLDIRRGETVGIVGRNGCGKSTLLQIICGTLQPTSGTVEVTGRISALLELGAGFNGEFTGRENVYMNGAILGFTRAEMDERFAAIADFAGIGDFIERPVKTYSSGMFVRLAFAVATAVEPDILVVDEALSVGDEAFQRKCFARIEGIKARGGTILFVSHSAQSIVQLCDRAILLDGGEKLMEGRPKLVVGQYQRLVNADPEAAAAIRDQIRALVADGAAEAPAAGVPETATVALAAEAGTVEAEAGAAAPEPLAAGPSDAEDAAAEMFDPGLVSVSAVATEVRGARITDPRVTTLGGDRVNILRMGRRYQIRYSADVDAGVTDLTFGAQIRTVTGVAVTGAHTSQVRSLALPRPPPEGRVDVAFEFSCILLPGAYFIVCGVTGKVDGEDRLLQRIYDAVLFRVGPETDLIATGHVDAEFRFFLS